MPTDLQVILWVVWAQRISVAPLDSLQLSMVVMGQVEACTGRPVYVPRERIERVMGW